MPNIEAMVKLSQYSSENRLKEIMAEEVQMASVVRYIEFAFDALRFAIPISELGNKLTDRMRYKGLYLALHLKMEKDVWNGLLVVSGSGPAVTSNWAVCCTVNPPVLPPIPPEGVKVPGGIRT
ncbi:hypothetical protein Tco_0849036 [Tanacetum coccineum]